VPTFLEAPRRYFLQAFFLAGDNCDVACNSLDRIARPGDFLIVVDRNAA
jgi:hypothetical protein